jgi:hypothetical protein
MEESTYFLQNSFLRIELLAVAGPRIIGLYPFGAKKNYFAELGDFHVETTYGHFIFHGGHRLWHSPESLPRTYIPDNAGLRAERLENGFRLIAPTEPGAGLAKTVDVHLAPDAPRLVLRHELRNDNLWAVPFSAWALTMFRLGGVAILPQPTGKTDTYGLLHNRSLSLWPYTRLRDHRLQLDDDLILIKADPLQPPFKIGYYNLHGWLAYYLDGILFRKLFDLHSSAAYPDGGCNAECYCNHQFLELESLSPFKMVLPAESLVHTETWELFESLDQPFLPPTWQERIKSL